MATDEYDAASQAAAANRFGAQLYVGFEARADERSLVSYFAVPTFESIGGRSLATHIVSAWCTAALTPPELRGMRLPVLRETRMPAVLCSLGPVRAAVDATDAVTDTVVSAVTAWTDHGVPAHEPTVS
jgi:N-acetylmuramoyl-L-alanine amidase